MSLTMPNKLSLAQNGVKSPLNTPDPRPVAPHLNPANACAAVGGHRIWIQRHAGINTY
jgi:hypothetical protein